MPLIDVSDVLLSLDIAQQEFQVLRRSETVNQYGEGVLSTSLIDCVGAVQPLGQNSLLREETFTTTSNGITVWTKTPLFNAGRTVAGAKYQPDLILWNGSYYLVRILDPWTGFGAGFFKAECAQTDYEDPIP